MQTIGIYKGLCFATWIDLLFNENVFHFDSRQQTTAVNYDIIIKQRKQVIAVKCLFCKILKRKCSQMKILKLLPFAKFHCASANIFLKFLRSKLYFLQEKQTSIWTKKSFNMDFLQFLERVRTQLPNLWQHQYVTNPLLKFQTNCTNRLFVVWVE